MIIKMIKGLLGEEWMNRVRSQNFNKELEI